ncbi:uncharacterized protein LOC114538532 [Dendronephthya gigantea]|uniref:uncharacterized protein LOC114538532 n=1 Tax=Dendronephthya gigantea TaxID=151771 RepID=UPI0010695084|nr:uncharacterized protein LOC114538532 [Dendronephthya gigantea]
MARRRTRPTTPANSRLVLPRTTPTCPPKSSIFSWPSETSLFLVRVTFFYAALLITTERQYSPALTPALPPRDPTPSTPQFSAESLRSLAVNLAPLLRDVLARDTPPSPQPPLPQPSPAASLIAQSAPTPSFDLGNPSSVATLISSSPVYSSSTSLPSETPSLPKKVEEQIVNGPKAAGQAISPTEDSAAILTGASRAQQTHVPSNIGVIDPAVADGMRHMNTLTPALRELMTLRVAENTSKEFVDRLKPVTPINVNLLESMLTNHPDREFVVALCSGLRAGFKIGYKGPRHPFVSPNLKTALMSPEIVDENLLNEVKQGHTVGPFTSPPFTNFQVYPLGLVPKKNSSKWRTIFHLSYPKSSTTSVNANISSEDYSLQYVRIDDAMRILLELGPNCFMAKTDVQSAFRNIPVHPDDWELLGMKWRGLYFFDRVLPFGLRSAPWTASNN